RIQTTNVRYRDKGSGHRQWCNQPSEALASGVIQAHFGWSRRGKALKHKTNDDLPEPYRGCSHSTRRFAFYPPKQDLEGPAVFARFELKHKSQPDTVLEDDRTHFCMASAHLCAL